MNSLQVCQGAIADQKGSKSVQDQSEYMYMHYGNLIYAAYVKDSTLLIHL